jgi:hypothetical protein
MAGVHEDPAMNRLIAACLLLILSCAGASAASCVITEFQLFAPGGVQVAKMPPLATPLNLTVTGASAQTGAFGSDTKMIRAWCDTQSAIEIGTNPTASVTVSTPLSAGLAEYFNIEPVTGLKAAFILRP